MASTWIHQCGGDIVSAAATAFFPLVGSSSSATEANAQILVRDTYTGSNLWVNVSANANDGTTTIRTRKNAINGAQSVSYAAAETGRKEDTVNTDAMATAENWNYSVTPAGATGSCTLTVLSILLQHSGTGTFILANATGAHSLAENLVRYRSLTGALINVSTEAWTQYTLRTDGTLRNLRVYVSSNSIAASTVVRTRKNAADGAQVATITASGTGSFEDTTNSDTVTGSAADAWNYVVDTTSAKMGTMVSTTYQIEYSCIGRPQMWSNSIVLAADRSLAFEGGETNNVQLTSRIALTIGKMFTYVSVNTATVADVYFRQNGVNAGPTVSYGSGVTGIKEDTVNTVSIVADDLINYFVDLTSGTSITFRTIGVEAQQGATVSQYPRSRILSQAVKRAATW